MRATLDTLYADYLARGCPCRFPRFRAVAKQWGLPPGILSSEDRDGLVGVLNAVNRERRGIDLPVEGACHEEQRQDGEDQYLEHDAVEVAQIQIAILCKS